MRIYGRLRFPLFLFALWLFVSCSSKLQRPVTPTPIQPPVHATMQIVLGNENLLQNYLHLVKGKRVGLLTNPSGVNHLLQSSVDVFAADSNIHLTALFGPEHGIRGAIYAGEQVGDETDPHTGLPVFSLYGKHRKPTKKMLEQVDVILVDIQDIGVRAYTYIYTMAKVMEAAAEFGKEVIVLDRPNPLGGLQVEGNLVQPEFFSFVGLYPIPYRHGMTIGELALLFNQEFNIHCNLRVIPLKGWKREMLWGDTGLPWVPTSPHVPHWETVLFMSSTGTIGELHAVSEGVGYTSPFELIGAPWIDGYQLAQALNALKLPGVVFRPLYFKPYYALFKGQICQGVQMHLTDYRAFNSYLTGLYIMETLIRLYPEHDLFADAARTRAFNRVMGCAWIGEDLKNHVPVHEIQQKWQREKQNFLELRKKYLLYE